MRTQAFHFPVNLLLLDQHLLLCTPSSHRGLNPQGGWEGKGLLFLASFTLPCLQGLYAKHGSGVRGCHPPLPHLPNSRWHQEDNASSVLLMGLKLAPPEGSS